MIILANRSTEAYACSREFNMEAIWDINVYSLAHCVLFNHSSRFLNCIYTELNRRFLLGDEILLFLKLES